MKIYSIIAGSCLLLSASLTYAAATDLNTNWTCTTNASGSDIPADKAADDQMANTKTSAAKAYAFAAEHCRDCTKITCEVND